MKYLNIILLTEFRNHIQRIQIQSIVELENEQIEDDQNSSNFNYEMNDGMKRRKKDIEISFAKVEEVENSYQQIDDRNIEDIEEQNLYIDKPNRVPISANSLNGEDMVNKPTGLRP